MRWTLYLLPLGMIFLMGCLKTRAEVQSRQNYQDNQTQVAQMQKASSFDTGSRLGEIEEALRNLTGKIEELEHRQTRLETSSGKIENLDQDPAFQELNKKLTLLLEELKNQKLDLAEIKSSQTLAVSGDSSKATQAPQDTWSQAEGLFESKDYRRAILSYQKYREQNPRGSQFAEATYKIGFSFEKLNMGDEAKSFYNEVIEKFAKSPEAKKAKIRLKKIK